MRSNAGKKILALRWGGEIHWMELNESREVREVVEFEGSKAEHEQQLQVNTPKLLNIIQIKIIIKLNGPMKIS